MQNSNILIFFSKSHKTRLPEYVHLRVDNILQYVQFSSQLNHYFLSSRVHRQTQRQTDRHTDGDEYSIVAVDKPQL